MAAWTEAERVKLRKWTGMSPIYKQVAPFFESAVTSVQAIADGGSQPDDSTVEAIRGYLAKLDLVEQRMDKLDPVMHGFKVDEVTADQLRGLAGLRQQGRRYVGYIADALYVSIRRDVFSPPPPATDG